MSDWMASDLPAAIYLNQRLVFDLLATIEDGLMQVRTETLQTSADETSTMSVEGSAGSGGVLARLVSLNLKGSKGASRRGTDQQHETGQRTHTPVSLFASLREYLKNEGLLKELREPASLSSMAPGDIVEFRAVLARNPLIHALEGMRDLLRLTVEISSATSVPATQQLASKQKGKSQQTRLSVPATAGSMEVRQIDAVLQDLTGAGTIDVVGNVAGPGGMRAVITAETRAFVGASIRDVIDGEFRVIGKATRILLPGTEERIDLLRKSSLGLITGNLLEQILSGFSQAQAGGLNIPDMTTSVLSPAVQVIPIAIFA